jgi:uncharacterized protein (DUF1697 family)
MKYVAFLRGINVGGNKKVEMAKLKQVFELMGFTQVKTLLNSGNVVFASQEKDLDLLTKEIIQALKTAFGWEMGIYVRSSDSIQALIEKDPFKGIKVTSDTRLYVTFTPKTEVCSSLVLSPDRKTPELMQELEKKYGQVTTRSWGTIEKIGKLLVAE